MQCYVKTKRAMATEDPYQPPDSNLETKDVGNNAMFFKLGDYSYERTPKQAFGFQNEPLVSKTVTRIAAFFVAVTSTSFPSHWVKPDSQYQCFAIR